MASITPHATVSATAATRKPKSRRVAGFRANASVHNTATAGNAATAAPIGGDLLVTIHSDCISETWLNQISRTLGSIMAKGPARHCGSIATNTTTATSPDTATPAARTGQEAPEDAAAGAAAEI